MQRLPSVYFAPSEIEGRGVFTYDDIPKGTLIEVCPVIIIPKEQVEIIHKTCLHDYYFLWGEEQDQAAIALGFGSLYNHSFEPNAEYLVDYSQNTFDFLAIRDIEAGEEIMVNYNGDNDSRKQLWFHK
ncbi:MAG: SET domain-containing protein [Saprospiraceae bacterium]